ncbi:unnamed protein product [Gadus morhua 'NCC']
MSVDEGMNNGKTGSGLTPSLQLLGCTAACNNISVMTEVKLSADRTDSSDITANCPLAASLVLPNNTSLIETCPNSEKLCQKPEGDENHINHSSSLQTSKQQQQQHQPPPAQPPQQQHQPQPKLSKRRNTANFGFNHPASGKRRRRANSESDSVLPSNFLLGGNIFDPLNLNSLLDEEVNKALNAETPKSSPLPSKNREPVEILIPRDITDPLNLNSGVPDSNVLVSPLKSGGRRRNRNRHHGGGGGGGGGGTAVQQLHMSSDSGKGSEGKPATGMDVDPSPATPAPSEPSAAIAEEAPSAAKEPASHGAKEDVPPCATEQAQSAHDDTVTSPTLPAVTNQHAGRRRRRRNSGKTDLPVTSCGAVTKHHGPRPPATQGFSTPRGGPKTGNGGQQQQQHHHHQQPYNQHKPQPTKFQYGNYNKYYGYRNPGSSEDPRLRVLRPEWFRGKDVLDLGCNAGHVTLYVAKVLRPARILGVDIDGGLVRAARKNIRHYLSDLETRQAREEEEEGRRKSQGSQEGVRVRVVPLAGDKQEEHIEVEGKGENGEAVVERGGGGGGGVSRHAEEGAGKKEVEQEMEDRGTKELQDGKEEREGKAELGPKEVQEQRKEEQRKEETKEGTREGTKRGADELQKEDLESRRRRRELQRSRMEEVEVEDCVDPAGGPGGCHFPLSLRTRGPIAAPPLTEQPPVQPGEFPSNVSFLKANYVLECDRLLLTQRPEYDVILCLSVTKWVHLNWGDEGLKRFFQRAYRHLRPGGIFVLEPQPWDTYVRRNKLTDVISKNYKSIRLKPDQFTNYLTTEVGFASYEFIGMPNSSAKGFQRPIYLFHK